MVAASKLGDLTGTWCGWKPKKQALRILLCAFSSSALVGRVAGFYKLIF